MGVGVLEPDVVVTMTSTVPADSGGDVAIRRLSDSTVTLVAAVVPKATVASEVKSVPATKTLVPPVVGPWWGTTALTTGAGVVAPATPDDVIKTPTGRAAAQRTKPNLRYMMTSFIYDDAPCGVRLPDRSSHAVRYGLYAMFHGAWFDNHRRGHPTVVENGAVLDSTPVRARSREMRRAAKADALVHLSALSDV